MSIETLSNYVVRVSAGQELPPGFLPVEYHGVRYGVLPKRGCGDCHGGGGVTRNGVEAVCDCLWRRMFDARHRQPAAAPAFLVNSPGMVDELRKRRMVLQKQLDDVRLGLTGTQNGMTEELQRHDQVVEQATQAADAAVEAHRTVQANIEHLEKNIEYQKGRADELRAQARELERQAECDRQALTKQRSHDLHQAGLESDRARKQVVRLQEDHNKILHRWHKQLRDPQRDVRKAEERLNKIDRQIDHLDVVDLADAPPPLAPAAPPEINPMTARGLAVPPSPLMTAAADMAPEDAVQEAVPETVQDIVYGCTCNDGVVCEPCKARHEGRTPKAEMGTMEPVPPRGLEDNRSVETGKEAVVLTDDLPKET